MAPAVPTTETLTLRLKHHRTTVFLYASPLQSLAELKTDLITALRETTPSDTLAGRPLPTSPEQITLGKPKDRNDYALGWIRIEEGEESKGKESIKLAGLKEGMVVAFKWGDESQMTENEQKYKWDVVLQTYDEVYGDDS
ncbi:hypothetical protein EJ05DRAFT_478815 [Pseudovirgaria hyperparasitica]|uniref:Ubiquitin-like domain-containing protein n=1 Tax=Pseudovirgaria hyperparasitica TaxID=470096 RepID=A0A6A6VZ14_9PEZI|nr:uncharacterized protein EJ05DRAFT_478815 [Pseudovirgaria hyperparasitica]KAF2754994.1 hypothetical protein EJ05DRAFT_478815 [Pseudovirgaria hyperparasitica]